MSCIVVMNNNNPYSIAVVGMACCYPEASSPDELWHNILAQRQSFRRIPQERLRIEDYVSDNPLATDLTYITNAAVIEGYEFDREKFRVMGNTYRSTDLSHWLALDVASRALEDAGFPNAKGLNLKTTGVLVGNTLTGEFSRASTLRLRWPYLRRILNDKLLSENWDSKNRVEFINDMESRFKAPFEQMGDETLAGSLSNTIPGRICNYFDFGGGGYTVDGACSSSLLSISNACNAISAGDLDSALVGGVDLSLDPFELVGFARLGALAKDEMRVYDSKPTGFIPGEGCGFVVLMREEDALEKDLRIYATIKGWGISSDGSGGLTRPEIPGQKLALQRAYQKAGYGIDTVGYFEGHGTGTPIGDTVELTAISESIRESSSDSNSAVIGSVKANIGHAKAAAGLAGLIKAIKVVNEHIVPPNTGYKTPLSLLTEKKSVLKLRREGRLWDSKNNIRVGVSSMGFGGINVHVTLENSKPSKRKNFSPVEKSLLTTRQDSELLLISADDRKELLNKINQIAAIAPSISKGELSDLAVQLSDELEIKLFKAAIVCSAPDELVKKLKLLSAWVENDYKEKVDPESGVFLGYGNRQPRITYLFSGQAAPANLDGGIMKQRFGFIKDLYFKANLPENSDGVDTSVAQPAITTASTAVLQLLTKSGIEASNAIGHSLGELTAYHWAGVYDFDTLLNIATIRGNAMKLHCNEKGGMASINTELSVVEKLIENNDVVIAGINSPDQTVVSGKEIGIEAIIKKATDKNIHATRLPVSHAFHSPLMAEAEHALHKYLTNVDFRKPKNNVISTITGQKLDKDLDLRKLLCKQLMSPVKFMSALRKASAETDLFIELGPGSVLTGISQKQVNIPIIETDAGGKSIKSILKSIAASFVMGTKINTNIIFGDRITRPFDLFNKFKFFTNPCESVPVLDQSDYSQDFMHQTQDRNSEEIQDIDGSLNNENTDDILLLLRKLIAAKTELPLDAITAESRLLDDLHLNSITVSQIVVETTKILKLPPLVSPSEFASASIAEVAEALENIKKTNGDNPSVDDNIVSGVDSWVRSLKVELVEKELPPFKPRPESGEWHLYAPQNHPFALNLKEVLDSWGGQGVIICLPESMSENDIELILKGLKKSVKIEDDSYMVFVQHDNSSASLARTAHLESKNITTCVVNVPYEKESFELVSSEVKAAHSYSEVHYNENGNRFEPIYKVIPTKQESKNKILLNSDDILLVTGGGKGIASECAFNLAKECNVRLVLFGRSTIEEDNELAENLKRFDSDKIDYHYIPVDVTNTSDVNKAINTVEKEIGAITAFIHGAGFNSPKLIKELKIEDFRNTLAPKIKGVNNVLDALNKNRLKLFVTFGSIIARGGLQGEGDYALANEWLTLLTERFQIKYPKCQCHAIEWSVWSGVGMGERLGRIEALKSAGISPITVESGIKILRNLLSQNKTETSTVVTGRFGNPDTINMDKPELPLFRFLENVKIYYPGIELITECELSKDTDPYVMDHVFRGEILFPAVMGLEAMAQVAGTLNQAVNKPIFENIEFNRPIVIPETGKIKIRIAALQNNNGEIEIVIRSSETKFAVDHFKAVCKCGKHEFKHSNIIDSISPSCPEVPLDPEKDLYNSLLFHRGRFKRINKYRYLKATECLAELIPNGSEDWYSQYLPQTLVLGDPAIRDAALHAVQVCVPDSSLLPVGVDRLEIGDSSPKEKYVVRAIEKKHIENIYTYDIELTDLDGEVCERWIGLRFQAIQGTVNNGNWVAPLLAPYIERKINESHADKSYTLAIDNIKELPRQSRSKRAIIRALGFEAEIQKRPDGKPTTKGYNVSSSHTGFLTMGLASDKTLGCDMEIVIKRNRDEWQGLLSKERFELGCNLSKEVGEDENISATRIWTVIECMKKAGIEPDSPVTQNSVSDNGWVKFSTGKYYINSFVADVIGEKNKIAMAVLTENGIS